MWFGCDCGIACARARALGNMPEHAVLRSTAAATAATATARPRCAGHPSRTCLGAASPRMCSQASSPVNCSSQRCAQTSDALRAAPAMARLATFSAFMLLAGSATAQGVARGSAAAVRAGDRRARLSAMRCACGWARRTAALRLAPTHAALPRAVAAPQSWPAGVGSSARLMHAAPTHARSQRTAVASSPPPEPAASRQTVSACWAVRQSASRNCRGRAATAVSDAVSEPLSHSLHPSLAVLGRQLHRFAGEPARRAEEGARGRRA